MFHRKLDRSRGLRLQALCGFLLMAAAGFAAAATSVSQYGITWTFTQDKQVGQFANGDWWVVGPVTISNINPKTTAGDIGNGSMINPIPGQTQGFYSGTKYPAYDASKNVSLQLPITVQAGNSVVSTIRNPDTWAANSSPDALVEKTWFKEVAVLTVVGSAPAAGSFRPPYAGTDKAIRTNWNKNSLRYSVLRSLAAPNAAHVPNRTWLEDATQRPLMEMHYNYLNSNWKASWDGSKAGGYPRRTYGREISHISSEAGLYLQTNVSNATKEKLLIHMCQWGIDVYGLLKAGMKFQPNGGHDHGRLMPLYIAAKVLGDSDMLTYCSPSKSIFQEFAQHWFVTQTDIDTPRSSPATMQPYTADMLGMPEWNSGGPGERNQASSQFWGGTGYRFINGAPNCTLVATILLMGGRSEINCEPLFQYIITRYYPLTKSSAAHTIPSYGDVPSLFTREMWDTHISGTGTGGGDPGGGDVPGSEFAIGNRIMCFRSTNVRATAALSGNLVGTQPQGATGLIVGGPVEMDNIIWWQVNFDSGADGWAGGDNFTLVSESATRPSKPQVPAVSEP